MIVGARSAPEPCSARRSLRCPALRSDSDATTNRLDAESSSLDHDRLSAAIVRRRGRASSASSWCSRPIAVTRSTIPWQDAAIAVRFHDEDASVDAIVAAAAERPVDGVIAVGDRPVGARRARRRGAGLPWQSAGRGARRARTSGWRASGWRAAGLPAPRFVPTTVDADAVEPSRRARYPAVVKPVRAVGQPRRDSRRHAGGSSSRRSAASRAAGATGRSARCAPARTIRSWSRLHRRPRVRHRRRADARAVLRRLADLRQAGSARRSVLRRDHLRDAVARSMPAMQRAIVDAVAAAAAALGLTHGPVHAECRVSPPTSVVRARSGGASDRRAVLAGAAFHVGRRATPRSLEDVLLRTRSARRVAGWRASVAAAAVMMIPIPARGILQAVAGEDARAAVPTSRTCGSPRSAISCSSRCRRREAIWDSSSRGRRCPSRRRRPCARRTAPRVHRRWSDCRRGRA